MELKSLKSFIFTLILVLSVSTSAFASTSGIQISKTLDGVKSTLTFATEKLKRGNNNFTIIILDKNGNPLTSLKVTAYADDPNGTSGAINTSGTNSMAAMPGMSGMSASDMPMIALKDSSTKGEYTGMVNFKSTGKWIVESTFDVKGQAKYINFNVNVKGPNFLIIGCGFLGVLVLGIAVAALNKGKFKKY